MRQLKSSTLNYLEIGEMEAEHSKQDDTGQEKVRTKTNIPFMWRLQEHMAMNLQE